MTRPALAVATHRLGLATLAATGVLILLGGLVTNTGAGLAVPEGSFLTRFSSLWMPGGQTTVVFLPVAHRLMGSLMLGAAVALAVRVADKP